VDDELREHWVRQLRSELTALDVERVSAAPGHAPAWGAKGEATEDVGSLLVSLRPAEGLLSATLGAIRDWLDRHPHVEQASVALAGDTLVLDRRPPAHERSDALALFLRRHEGVT
jgi:hypothetical protein